MPEGAKGTATDVYVLDTGDAAAERLRLLDRAYGPATRQLLLDSGLGRKRGHWTWLAALGSSPASLQV